MSNQLTWSEAEIFNARYESYDVYRAIVDPLTSEAGDYTLIVSLPIEYDWDMTILSQTLEYLDESADAEVIYAYKVIANASNGPGDPDGDFTQVSNIVVLGTGPDGNNLLQEDGFAILQEDGSFILIVSETPGGIHLLDHVVVSGGFNGSGSQEPIITLTLGAGDFIPLGQLYIGGGGNPPGDNFTIDGVQQPADPMAFRNFGKVFTDEWWNGASPPDGAAYEVRVTSLNGPAPNGVNDTWLPLTTDRTWQYLGVFDDIALVGQWEIEIRDASSLVVLADAIMSMTQVLG